MEKPLPDLPQSPRLLKNTQVATPTTLTVDAREHLHRFILHAIQDEGVALHSTGDNAEEWTRTMESSMSALAERMAMGGWLAGLRRARTQRTDERERARQKDIVSSGKHESNDVPGGKKEKEDSKSKSGDVQDLDAKEWGGYLSIGYKDGHPGSHTEEIWKEQFRSLQEAAKKPHTVIPKPTAKHLLLTVAPFGTVHPQPYEETTYEVIMPKVDCIFTPGVYTLPENVASEVDARAVVLHGFDSWDSMCLC